MAKLITDSPEESKAINIKIVCIGIAGSNIISRISEDVKGITSIIFNTDANALTYSKADIKIRIGEKITKGSGTGRDPEKGKFAANED